MLFCCSTTLTTCFLFLAPPPPHTHTTTTSPHCYFSLGLVKLFILYTRICQASYREVTVHEKESVSGGPKVWLDMKSILFFFFFFLQFSYMFLMQDVMSFFVWNYILL